MDRYNKFLVRGKPIDGSKDYVYGTLNIIEVCPSPIKVGQEDTDCNLYKITYRAPNTVADWNLPYPQKSTFVKPGTVGRYTGKDDSLGNKIFEGDIVSYIHQEYYQDVDKIGLIMYDNIRLQWMITDSNEYKNELCGGIKIIKIIGNKDDNKELLKEFNWNWSDFV